MKRKISLGLIALMLFSLMLPYLSIHVAYAVETTMSGEGTEAAPYIILTENDLYSVRDDLNAFYELGANIDLSNGAYTNWDPIQAFSGLFDGAGFTIKGLVIDRQDEDNVGFFGTVTSTAVIRNVQLEEVDVSGRMNVGGLAGTNEGSITDSSVTGEVTGYEVNVGGLVGNNPGTIDNSSVDGKIISNSTHQYNAYVGGLAGVNQGAITNSSSAGSVHSGLYRTGGLVGQNEGSISTSFSTAQVTSDGPYPDNVGGLVGYSEGPISNSYATGNVSGGYNVAGLIGYNHQGGKGGRVTNSYATGLLEGDRTGGLIAANTANTSWIVGSFYDKETSGQSDRLGTPKTTAEMQTKSTFTSAGWDFKNIWGITAGNYPTFDPLPIIKVTYDVNGATSGTVPADTSDYQEGDRVAVKGNSGNLGQTGYIFTGWNSNADGSGAAYKSGDTFTMGAENTTLYAQWKEWTMTGLGTAVDPYIIMTADQLDSVRHKPTAYYRLGAHINLSDYDNWQPIGDFPTPFRGKIDGNFYKITNLTIDRPSTNYVGLFGYAGSGAAIQNIALEQINVSGNLYTGGLAGNNSGTITNSYASGVVNGAQNTGGLVGENEGSISSSYANVSVKAENYTVGGLVGYQSGTITNSYASGTVEGNFQVGGLAGANYGTVTSSYASGKVIADSSSGGLIGVGYDSNNSFYDTETTEQSDDAGKGKPKTTAEMHDQSTFTGWDFETVWTMDIGDYPKLQPYQALKYSSNGATGGNVPTDSTNYKNGDTITVNGNSGSLEKTGYTFIGWNTKADGSGIAYKSGDTFKMGTAAVVLYAYWVTYTIDALEDQTLTALTEGYASGSQETRTITVTRKGNGDLTNLAAELSGADADDFETVGPAATTLNNGTPATTFTVKAKDSLPEGTYIATVTVSADNMTDRTFDVKQVVNSGVKGDANGDGLVTPADALMITKHMKGQITLTAKQFDALDMNDDGVLDTTDVQMIMAIYLGGQ